MGSTVRKGGVEDDTYFWLGQRTNGHFVKRVNTDDRIELEGWGQETPDSVLSPLDLRCVWDVCTQIPSLGMWRFGGKLRR